MKKYLFTNLANTWWAEYWTDGMQTTDNQKILSITSKSVDGTYNHTDIDATMIAVGLPNKVGQATTEVELVALAAAQNLTLTMTYEQVAAVTKNTALTLQTTPTFSPVAGNIVWGSTVTIASASADAIYYTTDGSIPTTASTRQSVTPLVIDGTEKIIKAIAVKSGKFTSAIGSAVYTQTPAAAPTNVVLAVGSATPVGGVTNVAIPADGTTDNTGKVTGWVTGTANKIKITVTDAASTASTITINGEAYVSAADYAITAVGTLTVVLTTTRANYKTTVRTFTIDVTA